MNINFYCGAGDPECGEEWPEEEDSLVFEHLSEETRYHSACPKCSAPALAHRAFDPYSP